MSRAIGIMLLCLSSLLAFGQSESQYQVATIVAVTPHQSKVDTRSDLSSYDVSLKLKELVVVVRYTPPAGMDTVKYVTGRQVLVLVGEKTITYNDLLGQSFELPIVSRRPVVDAK